MTSRKNENRKRGRPSVMTEHTIDKLYHAYSLGCTETEAAFYAGVNADTVRRYTRAHPEFEARKNALKHTMTFQAREAIRKNLTCSDKKERGITARWYLEKTDPAFSSKADININAGGGLSIDARSDALDAFLKRFE